MEKEHLVYSYKKVQIKTDDSIKWFLENPLTDPDDVQFVSKEIEVFLDNVKNSEIEKQNSKHHTNCKGMITHLLKNTV